MATHMRLPGRTYNQGKEYPVGETGCVKGISSCPFISSQNWGLPLHPRVLVVLQQGQDPSYVFNMSLFQWSDRFYLQYDPKRSAFGSCVSNI